MATADSVKTKLQNLISKANAATGKGDTNLSSAVDTLIAGYGKGGNDTPSGTISITENGTYDVAAYASAAVNVPVPAEKMVVLPITIATDLGAGTNSIPTIVTGNDFVKQHYADDGFAGLLLPVSAASITADKNVVTAVYHGNRLLITTSASYYAMFTVSNGVSSGTGVRPNNYKISANGYNVSLRAKSTGNIDLYVASTFTVKAGSYLLVLFCTD